MAGRRLTAAQARDRRSKRAAIGLGLVLIVVGVIQGPKLLKQLSPPAAPTSTPPAAPTSAGSSSTALPASTSSGSSTAVTTGTQLESFSLLANKDPFRAQVTDGSSSSSSASTVPAGTSPATTPPTTPATTPPTTPATTLAAAGPTGAVGFTTQPPNAALIKVNGHREVVAIGAPFPSSQPLFTLVKLVKKGIRIGVVGGSFTSGVPTLLLRKGHKVTLANESDGSHFVLQLVALTTATPSQSQPAGTSPTTPPATPTTTTTPEATPTTTTPEATPTTTTSG